MVIKKIFGLCKSLSARLLVTTALWVTFMVCAIGYTMGLSWEIERSARTQSAVASMPSALYRANVLADPHFSEAAFVNQLEVFGKALEAIKDRDALDFLADDLVGLEVFDREWEYVIKPLLINARLKSEPIEMGRIEQFAEKLNTLQDAIKEKRESFLDIQRRLQGLLMTLAVGSLFAIMFFLLRWVIRPTEQLDAGLRQVQEGKLSTRINLTGSTEFEAISDGFNGMAERLQDFVENLEAKVQEKTMAVEEKNRNLSQLYEVTSFFGQQHSVDELCEGFTSILMQFTQADACAVFLFGSDRQKLELIASDDLPPEAFTHLTRHPISAEAVAACLKSDLPLRITRDMPEDFLAELRTTERSEFKTAYIFHIRNGGKDMGLFVLYFKNEETLPGQTYRLYESFGANLGSAVDNLRLIERDQQYAVVQERTLMAQGLHDSIAQSLSFLNLQVQLLEDGLKNNDKALVDDTVRLIKAGVQESYEDVRELLLNFRERLHKESFDEGIATVIDRFESQTGLKVRLINKGNGSELSDKQKLQVIFIMQEALANVRKHSRATQVVVSIRNEDDFELSVSDNGIGIDEDILKERSKRHVGLNIMKERSSRIDAAVTVGPVDPALFASGTTVRLLISAETRKEAHL
ncbi:MAG: histidine kinase [Sutterellaceae bacterium]|nr:histidine kinase [Sutterellaceae bacterium]